MALAYTTRGAVANIATSTAITYTPTSTPTSDRLLLLTLVSYRSGASVQQPSVAGILPTWTHVGGVGINNNRRVDLYRGTGTVTAEAITATYVDAHHGLLGHIGEFDGADLGGTNASNAIVQAVTNSGTGTSLTVTLSAFGDAGNGAYGAFGYARNETATVGSGWTSAGGVSSGTGPIGLRTLWRADNDTTCDITLGASVDIGGVAVELLPAGGGGGGPAARLTDSIILASPLFGGIYLR